MRARPATQRQRRDGEDRRGPTDLWRPYLGAVLLVAGTASAVLPDRYRMLAVVVAEATALLAIGTGVRRYRPAAHCAWGLIGAVVLIDLVAYALTFRYGPGTTAHPGASSRLPEAIGLLRYPVFGLALMRMSPPRAGHSRTSGLVDAAIVSCGIIAVSWAFTIDPMIAAAPDALRAVTLTVRPMLDLLLVVMVVRLVLISRVRTPALLMLAAAVGSQLAAVPVLAPTFVHDAPPRPVLGLLPWVVSAALTGAAALHPSMAARLRQPDDVVISRPRLTVFAVLAFAAPLTATTRLLEPATTLRAVLPAILISAILSTLLVLRVGQMAGVAHRRTAEAHAHAARLADSLIEQKLLQHELSYRAMHDALTGLPNRALLLERLERALARTGTSHALLIVDLDGFKDVNDTFGHPVGDDLLGTAAQRLEACLPSGATLARLGGDEFAILLENVPVDAAYGVAHCLVGRMRAPFPIEGNEVFLTVSVGMLTTAGGHRSTAEVMRDADLALYAAKSGGRNKAVVFSPRLRSAYENRARLTAGLREALGREEFSLRYQPVVDLRSGRIQGLEALLRWSPRDGDPVPPDQFIPVAEEIGLIGEIGDWVIDRACRDMGTWHARFGFSVAVNVSGRQLTERTFSDRLIATLAAHDLPGSALVVEITESVLVASTTLEADMVRAHLERLRAHGVRVAIDDFGTGYSSLAYLRDLPVDVLKIDRTFTSVEGDGEAAQQHRAFTSAIVQLSESLGLQTVAEGVETEGQADLLRQMHCSLAQGYLFSRPISAAGIETLVNEPQEPAAPLLTDTVAQAVLPTGPVIVSTSGPDSAA